MEKDSFEEMNHEVKILANFSKGKDSFEQKEEYFLVIFFCFWKVKHPEEDFFLENYFFRKEIYFLEEI